MTLFDIEDLQYTIDEREKDIDKTIEELREKYKDNSTLMSMLNFIQLQKALT